MALIHPSSAESTQTGLDLFDIPPTQTAVTDGFFEEHHPLSTLSYGAPIQFTINGDTEFYLDLQNTFLHIKAKVTKADGTNLDDRATVAPVNNWLHSLFSQVDVYLNGTLITPSDNSYPYRAYLSSLLTTNPYVKKGVLTSELYYQDTPGKLDIEQAEHNDGLKSRQALSSKSKTLDLYGPLAIDISQQSKFLPPGVTVQINLTPSKSSFNLIADDPAQGYKSVITHASLHVRKSKVNPGIILAHEKVLSNTTAKYPIKRIGTKIFGIPGGQLSHIQDNLFMSQTPVRLFVTLVDTDAFGGVYKKNPFDFKTKDLNFLSLYLDGKQIPSGTPLTPNYEHGEYVRAYHGLMSALGLANNLEAGGVLSYQDFAQGFTIYGFDLSPSLTDGDSSFELLRSSPLRIELKFAKELDTAVNVVCLGVFDNIIEIDKTRQVLKDF